MKDPARVKTPGRRLLALLLCTVMLLGLLPAGAFAADANTVTTFYYCHSSGDPTDIEFWMQDGANWAPSKKVQLNGENNLSDYVEISAASDHSDGYKGIEIKQKTATAIYIDSMYSSALGTINNWTELTGGTYYIYNGSFLNTDPPSATKQKQVTFSYVGTHSPLAWNGFQFVMDDGTTWIAPGETKNNVSVKIDTATSTGTVSWDPDQITGSVSGYPYIYAEDTTAKHYNDGGNLSLSGGEVYYLTDSNCTTDPPTFTVKCYGDEGAELNSLGAYLRDTGKTAWSATPNPTADFTGFTNTNHWVSSADNYKFPGMNATLTVLCIWDNLKGSEGEEVYVDLASKTDKNAWYVPGKGLYDNETDANTAVGELRSDLNDVKSTINTALTGHTTLTESTVSAIKTKLEGFIPDDAGTAKSVTVGEMAIEITKEPTPGSASDEDGEDGTYDYSLKLTKGTVVETLSGSGVITAPAYVKPEISITDTSELNPSVLTNESVTLSVTASASPADTLSYQWYSLPSSATEAKDGSSIPGANSSSYAPPTSANGTIKYYCVVSGLEADPETSALFTVTVSASATPVASISLKDGEAPAANVTLLVGGAAKDLSVVFDPPETTVKTFTTSTSVAGKVNVTGTSGKITLTPVEATEAGTPVVVTVTTDSKKTGGSESATAQVNVTVVKPVITVTSPAAGAPALTVKAEKGGEKPTLTVAAEVAPTGPELSYAWYTKSDSTSTVIPGAETASYNPSTDAVGVTSYFCRVSAPGADSVDSPAFTVTISEPETVTTTFTYVGTKVDASWVIAKWLGFKVFDKSVAGDAGFDVQPGESGTATVSGVTAAAKADNVTVTLTSVKAKQLYVGKVWYGSNLDLPDQTAALDGSTWYIYDDGVKKDAPAQPVEKTTYTFTVHSYDPDGTGHGYLGGWMAKVVGGTETAWSPKGDNMMGAFAADPANTGWKVCTVSKAYTAGDFNRFAFQTGLTEDNPFSSGAHNLDFTGTSGECWIISGDTTAYATKAAAQAAATVEKVKRTYTVKRPGNNWTVSSAYLLTKDGWKGPHLTATIVNPTPTVKAFALRAADPTDSWGAATLTWELPKEGAEAYTNIEFSIPDGSGDMTKNTKYTQTLPAPAADGNIAETVYVLPDSPTVYTASGEKGKDVAAAVEAASNTITYTVTAHLPGEGIADPRLGAWITTLPDYSPAGTSAEVTMTTDPDRKGYVKATVSWTLPKNVFNQVGFQMGDGTPWAGTSYTYSFTPSEKDVTLDLWVSTSFGSWQIFTDQASIDNASSSSSWAQMVYQQSHDTPYSFNVHYMGEFVKFGSWLAKVSGGSETAWSDSKRSSNISSITLGAAKDGWSSGTVTFKELPGFNRLCFQIGKDWWQGGTYKYDYTGTTGDIWVIPNDMTVYTTRDAAEAAYNRANSKHQLTVHCCGKDYFIEGTLSQAKEPAEGAKKADSVSFSSAFQRYRDGWGTAEFFAFTNDALDRFTFRVAKDQKAVSSAAAYTYDLNRAANDLWIIPGDPTIYPSRAAAEAALLGTQVPTFDFTVHYKGASGYIGAWLSRVENGVETDTAPTQATLVVPMTGFDGIWSTAHLHWDLSDKLYNRLSFQIGPDNVNLWNNLKYTYLFENGCELWVIPGTDAVLTDPVTAGAPSQYLSTQRINVDGAKLELQAFTRNDGSGDVNYVKIRDLAKALSGTAAQFEVAYDGTIKLTTGKGYTADGSEGSAPAPGGSATYPAATAIEVNGTPVQLDGAQVTDPSGGGYTYCKLRELGQALGFNVGWSKTKGIFLETDKPYDAEN